MRGDDLSRRGTTKRNMFQFSFDFSHECSMWAKNIETKSKVEVKAPIDMLNIYTRDSDIILRWVWREL